MNVKLRRPVLKTLIFAMGLFMISPRCFAGAGDRGGGDLMRSTIAQIERALEWNTFSNVLSDIVIQTKSDSPIHLTDPQVIAAVKKMEGDPLVSKVITGKMSVGGHQGISLIKKYDDEPCFEPDHDLSNRVTILPDGTKKAEICIQMQRFTRVPESALRMEIGAALVHELIEIATMPHSTALYVQQYILKQYSNFCILQVYPAEGAPGQGHLDRYRVYLRDLPNLVTLKGGPEIKMEWLHKPYPNAPLNPTPEQHEEMADLSRINSVPISPSTSEDHLYSTMVGRDRSFNNFVISKEKSSVKFQAVDRSGKVHQLTGTWGEMVAIVDKLFYIVPESDHASILFTYDGHPFPVRHVELYGSDGGEGCFPPDHM